MESRHKAFVSFAILIVLIMGLYFFTEWFSAVIGYITGGNGAETTAQCLATQDSRLYIKNDCYECDQQRDILGKFTERYIEVVSCDDSPERCKLLNKVPAWRINDTAYYDIENIAELQQVSGCLNE